MSDSDDLETRLARVVDHHARHGELPSLDAIVADRQELADALSSLVRQYLDLSNDLESGALFGPGDVPAGVDAGRKAEGEALPVINGFRTIERIGRGGMGSVYKLQDLALDRVVAAKVLDRRGPEAARLGALLREARAMAIFSDPRIVRIFEFRAETDPPVIVMEHVEGFELGRIGPSLEFRQRASVMRSIADAVAHAHAVGVQHRDLKPSNIMLDSQLSPKILDFGLSDGNPSAGHLRGTPAYIAPEQLDPSQPIDARTDVYALGVIFYELLSGSRPYDGATDADLFAAIRRGRPRLESIDGSGSELPSGEGPLDEQIEARRMLGRCERVIEDGLTPLQRRIFHLKHLRRQPIRTIARALGKSEDAIKANLYRMRRAIAQGVPGIETLLGH